MGKLNVEDIVFIVVTVALLGISAYLSFRLHESDKANALLQTRYDAAQQQIGQLQAGIKEQNAAVDKLGQDREAAEAKSDAAWATVKQQAASIDTLRRTLLGKKAATCAEAMPALRQALQGVPQ